MYDKLFILFLFDIKDAHKILIHEIWIVRGPIMFLKILNTIFVICREPKIFAITVKVSTCKKQRNIVSTAMLYTEKKVEAMA